MRSRSVSAPGRSPVGLAMTSTPSSRCARRSGVEARGHEIRGRVAARQTAVERRKPAAQVERFPGTRLPAASCTTDSAWPRVASNASAAPDAAPARRACAERLHARRRSATRSGIRASSASSAAAANSWLCEKIAAERAAGEQRRAPGFAPAAPRLRRDDQVRGAGHLARARSDARRAAAPSGSRRSAPAGREFTKSASRACTRLRFGARSARAGRRA